jgi:hypothetical protein
MEKEKGSRGEGEKERRKEGKKRVVGESQR